MGDRVLMQCYSSKTGEFGPVVYCHWAGDKTPAIVRALAKRMETRPAAVDYSTARLVQEAVVYGQEGALSFGVSNSTKKLTAKDSHGDAGVVLIDVDNAHQCECIGGYLKDGTDGYPVSPY